MIREPVTCLLSCAYERCREQKLAYGVIAYTDHFGIVLHMYLCKCQSSECQQHSTEFLTPTKMNQLDQ